MKDKTEKETIKDFLFYLYTTDFAETNNIKIKNPEDYLKELVSNKKFMGIFHVYLISEIADLILDEQKVKDLKMVLNVLKK